MTARSTRGRPRGTSKRELELIAMRLFTEQGFEDTTVEQIAAAAGVSGRTFFRYFPTKAEVLWYQFDDEVTALRTAFAEVPDDVAMMTAVRRVVVNANRYRAEDVPELRTRMQLVATIPALAATAGAHYDAWERAVSDFAARRLGEPNNALIPLAVGRTTLAAARAAFDAWLARADADLTVYLEEALRGLERGFAPGTAADGVGGAGKTRPS
ncbi:mycofactocin system transcriptional regulator [Nocardia sp. NPDC060256]|uniref:mycofactocin system transcriptional regulator n=1 Tax=unclassified Nocardia TaxID=2637762 RepID=UPI0036685F62